VEERRTPTAQTTRADPYRGLLAFGVADAPLCFGRRSKMAELRKPRLSTKQPAKEASAVGTCVVAVVDMEPFRGDQPFLQLTIQSGPLRPPKKHNRMPIRPQAHESQRIRSNR
jgi:hypothetical protein